MKIFLSKGIYKKCTPEEIVKIEKDATGIFQENDFFMPWPPTDEEREIHKNTNVRITFISIDSNAKYDESRMLMIIPIFYKEEGCNALWIQLKDEFDKIDLTIQNAVTEGHFRAKT